MFTFVPKKEIVQMKKQIEELKIEIVKLKNKILIYDDDIDTTSHRLRRHSGVRMTGITGNNKDEKHFLELLRYRMGINQKEFAKLFDFTSYMTYCRVIHFKRKMIYSEAKMVFLKMKEIHKEYDFDFLNGNKSYEEFLDWMAKKGTK